jgi:hypothetical protein
MNELNTRKIPNIRLDSHISASHFIPISLLLNNSHITGLTPDYSIKDIVSYLFNAVKIEFNSTKQMKFRKE